MNNSINSSFRSMSVMERAFIIGTIIWILLQASRLIAIVLINDIDTGNESEAWRYPAYLDLFAAVFALPLIWAVWMRRNVLSWTCLVVYWAISIVDHVGNFVTTTFVGPPSIAEGMNNPYLVPFIQNTLDIVFLALLFVPRFRNLFFYIQAPSPE